MSNAPHNEPGFQTNFLGLLTPLPRLPDSVFRKDVVGYRNTHTIPYMHFSVCLSKSRRLAHFVAWNVDTSKLVDGLRDGSPDYDWDDRIPRKYQTGSDVYTHDANPLDHGHIARRADVAWGPWAEAKKANDDSFYYTNLAPQHKDFNQSRLGGVWGRIENHVIKKVEEYGDNDDRFLRIAVIAGPVFGDNDPEFRGVRLPLHYWKLVSYLRSNGSLASTAFVVSQRRLIKDLLERFRPRALVQDPLQRFRPIFGYKIHQRTIGKLSSLTGLDFSAYEGADVFEGRLRHKRTISSLEKIYLV